MENKKLFVFAFWILCASAGVGSMLVYSLTPGSHPVVRKIPTDSEIQISKSRPNLLVFLHPKCSCSHATLSELRGLLPDLGETSVTIIFNNPNKELSWISGDLFQETKKLPNVKIFVDDGSLETLRFGVKTSGHVVLMNETGKAVFSGGITPMRGHGGENIGTNFIRSWIKGRGPASSITDIFGCGLFKGNL